MSETIILAMLVGVFSLGGVLIGKLLDRATEHQRWQREQNADHERWQRERNVEHERWLQERRADAYAQFLAMAGSTT